VDYTTARALVERHTAFDSAPVLTQDEIAMLLSLARAEQPWMPDTLYGVGVSVTSSDPTDDLRWTVGIAGYSGATEPTWADGVVDGGVVWVDGGSQTFDIYGAAAIGWEWKAAKTAGKFDHTRGDQSWSRSQMYAHCIRQAEWYWARSSGVARAAVGTTTPGDTRRVGVATAAPADHLVRVDVRDIEDDLDALP